MSYSFFMKKGDRKIILPVIITQDEDGTYLGEVPSLRGCRTQGDNLEELHQNLEEVVSLCLEMEEDLSKEIRLGSHIVSMEQMEFSY